MARKTLFCVDTYERAARGRLTVKDHREFKSAEECVQRAESVAHKVVGVLAYTIEADHEFEDYSEPRVLARHGVTPDE